MQLRRRGRLTGISYPADGEACNINDGTTQNSHVQRRRDIRYHRVQRSFPPGDLHNRRTLIFASVANYLSAILLMSSLLVSLSTLTSGYAMQAQDQMTPSDFQRYTQSDADRICAHHTPIFISSFNKSMLEQDFTPAFHHSEEWIDWNVTVQQDISTAKKTFERRSALKVFESSSSGGRIYTEEDFNDDYSTEEYDYIIEYFAFDDDDIRYDDCRRNSWHYTHQPTCNHVHEVGFHVQDHRSDIYLSEEVNESYHFQYVASGSYRDTFSINSGAAILKIGKLMELDSRPPHELWEMIRLDAMVMDKLSNSKRIVDIYSHCGVSVVVQFIHGPSIDEMIDVMNSSSDYEEYEDVNDIFDPTTVDIVDENKQIEHTETYDNKTEYTAIHEDFTNENSLHQEEETVLPNEIHNENAVALSPSQKLEITFQMASAIAELHGFKDGPIVHNDIQYVQYLLDEDLNVYLSDFNRADTLLWNNELQSYCTYFNGAAHGNVRSPEEYEDKPLNEAIDVYSFGIAIFTLLSGREPYRYINNQNDINTLVLKGVVPVVESSISGNSFAEASLTSIMYKCLEYYAEKRVDIFNVLSLLQDAIELNRKLDAISVSEHLLYEEQDYEELILGDYNSEEDYYYYSEDLAM